MAYTYPMFRTLRADEIECRVGHVSREGKGISLLLYKDARCDMKVLDETVGPMNWKKVYSRDNANCAISIWDPDKAQWVSKEDTGTESNTEAEKGLASDSFKRAAVVWGIGRELYTAPLIWIQGGDSKEKYQVAEIGYDDNRNINSLVITDKKGTVVFRMGKMTAKRQDPEPKKAPEPQKATETDIVRELCKFAEDLGVETEYFKVLCNRERLSDIGPKAFQNLVEHPKQVKEGYAQWKQSAS